MDQLIFPDAGQWIGALQAGQQAGMTQRKNAAATTAGGFMANGDYKGAAAALYGAGDIAGGSAVAQAGYSQKTEADKLARQQTVQQHIASNDLPGAYAAAGTDKDLIDALDKVTAHAKDTNDQVAAALQALKGPDGNWLPPDQARAKYAAIKPTLLARGLPAAQLDNFDPTPENLQAMQGQTLGLAKQLEMAKPVVVGNNLVNPQSGKEVYKGDEYKTVGPGQTLLHIGGNNDQTAATGQPAAVGGGPQMTAAETAPPAGGVYDQVAQIAASKGAKPEEVTYLQRLAQVESHGDPGAQNGRSTGLFQFHPDTMAAAGGGDINSVKDQTAAALNLSRHDRAKLQGIGVEPSDANVYIMHQQGPGGGPALLTAPPEVNAIAALTPVYGSADIARKAIVGNGGTPDMTAGQFVDMWRQRWANGGRPVGSGAPGAPAAAPAATPAPVVPGAPQVVYKGAPEWQSDGKGNLINAATGDRKVDPTGAGDIVANPDLVKAIIEGRAPVPTANRAATDPKWQAAMAQAMAEDPTLDAANYQTRVKTRADFATGTAAKTKTALNTALGHAGDLDSQIDALHNTGLPAVNMVGNYVGSNVSDQRRADINTFNLTKEALMHEAMKVFSGSAGSLMEFKQLADTLDVNDGPKAQHAVVKKLVGLLASKMDALGEQYKTGMGKELDQSQIMSPHAQDVFAKISGLPRGVVPAPRSAGGGSAGSPQAPLKPTSQAEFEQMPVGTWFINPADGRKLQKTH